ncbi:MAG: hypothetical protein H6744_15690 [Deltaproteobacteria bacterium]|nr:hypothetical protein [Deltaproteobacteria bacterium]
MRLVSLRTTGLLSLLAIAGSLSWFGCADSTTGPQGGADVTGADTVDSGAIKQPPTPLSALTVQTGVSDDAPSAGVPILVRCEVQGLAEGQGAPPTHWELYETPANILYEPMIDGDHVTFRSVATYKVRCILDATNWIDPTPVIVKVEAGPALNIDTTVNPGQLAAGSTADVSCSGHDEFDNVVEEGWQVFVAPDGPDPGGTDGLIHANFKLKALTVGTYGVTCKQKNGPEDASPAIVTVTHGQPYRLVTTLGAPSIVAGYSTTVACHAEDKQGNAVPEFPMAIDMPTKLTLTGFAVSGTISGKYAVRCVPQALDWTLFSLTAAVLEVTPDVPVTMELALQPPKPFFATYEKMTLVVVAQDQYGNPVVDAATLPADVTPAGAPAKFFGEKTLAFTEEGVFTISVRLADTPTVGDSVDVQIDGAPPSVTVLYPERGATLQGAKPSVTVSGLANDTITGVAAVRVNGVPAKIKPDGTWTVIIIPRWGLNVLVIEAEDMSGAADGTPGQITTITQSFYYAEKYYPMDPAPDYIPDAIKVWLDDSFLDDGNHNPTHPDDLATILEGAVAAFDLGAILPPPMSVGLGYDLILSNLSMNPPSLYLDPFDGGLHFGTKIKNMSIKVKLKGECKVFGIDLCPDFGGKLQIGLIDLKADLLASAKNAVMDVSLVNAKVNLEAINIDIDGILGWLFDWLIDFLVNIFTGTIEDLFESQVGALVGDTLTSVLDSLAINQTFDVAAPLPGMDDISLTLASRVHSLAFTDAGGRLGLGAVIDATKKVPQNPLGSLARGTCLKGYSPLWNLPGQSSFEAALWDDFINELLMAVWYGGTLNLSLDEDAIAGLTGGDSGGLGIPVDSMAMNLDFLLPPIINGCNEDGLMKLQIGDLFVDVDMVSPLFGGEGRIGVYVDVEMTMELITEETDEGTTFGVLIHGIDNIWYHWEYVPELFEGEEAALQELLESALIDGALADLTGAPIGGIALPTLDLGELSPLFAPGTVITPVLDALVRDNGHTLLQGSLE